MTSKSVKKIIVVALINLVVIAGIFVGLELIGRGIAYFTLGPKISRYILWEDPELGWVLNTQVLPHADRNRCGEEVLRTSPADPLIVREPQASGKTTVLFLGDSYTHAHEVSSGQAYYDVFESEAGGVMSVFAVGVGGYGSLQEYLALEKVYDRIRPDVVIWQLSGNDVENNVFAFEKAAIANNSQRPRPYLDLDTGSVEINNPGFFFLQYSDLGRFLFQKFLAIDQKFGLGLFSKLKNSLYPRGEERVLLRKQGLQVLDVILRMAMQKYPNTEFYGFCVEEKFDTEFEQIFRSNGANYFRKFRARVDQVGGTDCRPLDAHWNHHGNRVAGRELLKLFELSHPGK